MVWHLLRTIEPPAKSQGGKTAQIFTASDSPISHMSVRFTVWDDGVPGGECTALLPFQHQFNVSLKKKRGRNSKLKNHVNAKCKIHSCLIPLPPLRCFRTSSPDVGKVFCISKPKKKVFCLRYNIG